MSRGAENSGNPGSYEYLGSNGEPELSSRSHNKVSGKKMKGKHKQNTTKKEKHKNKKTSVSLSDSALMLPKGQKFRHDESAQSTKINQLVGLRHKG